MKIRLNIFLGFFLMTFSWHFSSAQPIYEFRGVWIATVQNIDMPSSKYLSSAEQRREFIQLLDMHQANGMNAVIVQIRPVADAFYTSNLVPWSEYLTGEQGKAPDPYYDPLAFMIAETHKRGMEFHAWLNPYRAVYNIKTSSISPDNIINQHPEWLVTYNNQKIFNPGLPEVKEHIIEVIKEIITKYQIDALHIDDYFYPYPDRKNSPFDDEAAYQEYGNGMNKDDWRRSNCDSIIKAMYETVATLKPQIKFGISPFGVWRNNSVDSLGSATRAGLTNYDNLYADILLWVKNGWVDYIAPQLYWERENPYCPYDTLLNWWNKYAYGKHLYIGHALYKVGTTPAWRNPAELPTQIELLRNYPTTQGSVYFSSNGFQKNLYGFSDSLRNNYYKYPALPPPMDWIDVTVPGSPSYTYVNADSIKIEYLEQDTIKAFLLLSVDKCKNQNLKNARIEKIMPYYEEKKTYYLSNTERLPVRNYYLATVSWQNNISPWIRWVER